jgi:predicted ATPase
MAPKSLPVPMITRVRLRNFRSIPACDVELGPLTILVGPNGAGKSNFLQALDFVADALDNGLESAVRRRGGLSSLMSRWSVGDSNAILGIEIEVALPDHRWASYILELARTQEDPRSAVVGYALALERCVVSTRTGRNDGDLAYFVVTPDGSEWWDVRGVDHVPRVFPGLGPPQLTLPHVAEHLNFGLVYRALKGIACYSLHVSEMRRPQEADGGELLTSSGSNVASVYDRMAAKNSYGVTTSDRLLDWMRIVNPEIIAVHALRIAGYMTLQFEQQADDRQPSWMFDASEMSYGTLRTFGVLVALFQGRMRDISPATLVGIEDPESAVHPGASAALLEAMIEASLVTQVVATTHSTSLLDSDDFDVGRLRVVMLKDGRTTIGPVDSVNRSILEQALYTVGELLKMRQLRPEETDNDRSTGNPVSLQS